VNNVITEAASVCSRIWFPRKYHRGESLLHTTVLVEDPQLIDVTKLNIAEALTARFISVGDFADLRTLLAPQRTHW